MTRRRLLELLVALAVLLLLLLIVFVRPAGWLPRPPGEEKHALFHRVPGSPPDFAAGGFQVLAAKGPDGKRTAVLYPVEFEMPADLYVLTGPAQGYRLELADSLRATRTPKNVGWLDEQRLWVTVGELYGTVSPGGDLWAVDPEDGSARLLWATPDSGRTQAVAAEAGPRGPIAVRLKAFDANMIAARDSAATVPAGR